MGGNTSSGEQMGDDKLEIPATDCISVEGRFSETEDGALRYDWAAVTLSFETLGSTEVWARLDGGSSNFTLTTTVGEEKFKEEVMMMTGSGSSLICLGKGLPLKEAVRFDFKKRNEALSHRWIGKVPAVPSSPN